MASNLELDVNIGLRERKARLVLGILFLAGSFATAMYFITAALDPLWSLALLPFIYQGIRFLLDYRTGTCPLKAELGQCNLDATLSVFGEKIEDQSLAEEIRAKSRTALVQAGGAALVLTLLTMVMMSVFNT